MIQNALPQTLGTEVYAEIAEEVCLDYLSFIRAKAVENEQNPAKLKWNC
ncbi:MAG: hypothetical protein FWH01_04880 [Oscillospiraceae bacterium]|nr:hypothetical protein [Oscillospiraceae bacterium]